MYHTSVCSWSFILAKSQFSHNNVPSFLLNQLHKHGTVTTSYVDLSNTSPLSFACNYVPTVEVVKCQIVWGWEKLMVMLFYVRIVVFDDALYCIDTRTMIRYDTRELIKMIQHMHVHNSCLLIIQVLHNTCCILAYTLPFLVWVWQSDCIEIWPPPQRYRTQLTFTSHTCTVHIIVIILIHRQS